MVALARPSRRWQVLLNCGGGLISTRRMELEPKGRNIFSPMVSKEQYEADRRQARLSGVRGPAERRTPPNGRGSGKPMLRLLPLAR